MLIKQKITKKGLIMYYSYVMGIGKEIYSLTAKGFTIKKFGENYGVLFSKDKNCIIYYDIINYSRIL